MKALSFADDKDRGELSHAPTMTAKTSNAMDISGSLALTGGALNLASKVTMTIYALRSLIRLPNDRVWPMASFR